MAFVSLLFKAARIEEQQKQLEDEKKKAVERSQGGTPTYGIKQKYRHFWINVQENSKQWLETKCTAPKNSCFYRTMFKLRRDGTCENFTFKSLIGFIGGCLLTYMCFMFFVFQLNFKLSTATIMCSIIGSILTIGLAFSFKVRCVVFLLLPQLFSKRGRQALIAYAFILAITGPAKNTLHNMGILSESLACGQEQLKVAVKQILEMVKKPFYAIRDAIKTVVGTVKVIVKKIKEVLLTIKRIIMSILRVIKAAFQFLGKILSICNKELGTPFQRCMRVFEDAVADCHAKLGPLFSWVCSITYLIQNVCYIVKIFDVICVIVDFISDSIIGVVVRKVKIFVRHVRTMFYVRIKFSHSFHFETNQSKSVSDIAAGIVTEIRQRTEKILTVFDFMSCATSLFFFFIILKVLHYRYKFLTNERFDNRFITKTFRDIDMKRAQMEKETILPLNHRERSIYISAGSLRLVKSERVKLSKAAVVLGMTTLKLSTHMMVDYALYWVLTVIRYHARFQSSVQAPNIVGLHVQGEGFLAQLLKSIVKAFQPLGLHMEIDTVPCLPDPIPPDYDRYIQIVSLLVLCWILTIFEPYGLRLRHSVMCFYHPTRAKQRAIWLYNHIMKSRSSFLKFARRQLRRKVLGSKEITKVTCKEYLRANINSKWLRLCLGSDKQDACLLCAEVFRESDEIKPIRCSKPGCPGIYCEQCFSDLHNLCTVCMEPIQYGDLSDISEEKDSSGDEALLRKKKRKRKCKISKCLKPRSDDESEDYDDDDTDNRKRTITDKLLQTSESEHKEDSDYHSEEGTTTDNSYTYQKEKDYSSPSARDMSSPRSKDIEMQKIPDYAAWQDLYEEQHSIEEDVTAKTTSSSHSTVISQLRRRSGKQQRLSSDQRQSKSTTTSDILVKFIPSPPERFLDASSKSESKKKKRRKRPSECGAIYQRFFRFAPSKHQRLYSSDEESPSTGSSADIELYNLGKSLSKQMHQQRRTSTTKSAEYLRSKAPNLQPSAAETETTGPFLQKRVTTRSLDETEPTLSEWEAEFEQTKPFTDTSSSVDSEIKFSRKCKEYNHDVPRLNLNFNSTDDTDSAPTTGSRFNENVKYEVVKETCKSQTSKCVAKRPRRSPRSPLNVGYQIYVPRFDKFVDRTELLKQSAYEPSEFPQACGVERWKDSQRKRRSGEITIKKLKCHLSSEPGSEGYDRKTLPIRVQNLGFPEEAQEIEGRRIHKQKTLNYYKEINKKRLPNDNPKMTKDQNKLFQFIKTIFRKERTDETDPLNSRGINPNVSGPCNTSNCPVNIPRIHTRTASPNYSSTISTPSSGHDYLHGRSLGDDSTEHSLLMGSVTSHIRGGEDSKLKTSNQSTTVGKSSTESTTTQSTGTKPKLNSTRNVIRSQSSDSEITDIDIFFNNKQFSKTPKSSKKEKREKLPPEENLTASDTDKSTTSSVKFSKKKTKTPQKLSEKGSKSTISSESIASKRRVNKNKPPSDSETTTSHFGQSSKEAPMNVSTTTTDSTSTVVVEEPTPLYSRQPAERDQDPRTRLQKSFAMDHQHRASDNYPLPPPNPPEKYFNNYKDASSLCNQRLSSNYQRHDQRLPPEGFHYGKRSPSEDGRRSNPSQMLNYPITKDSYPYPSSSNQCHCTAGALNDGRVEGTRNCRCPCGEPTENLNCNPVDFPSHMGDNTTEDRCNQNVCVCNSFEVTPSDIPPRRRMDDENSCCSACSCQSEYLDLAYQNTDEFYDLVNELGDTLSQRNKERVQRTMQEFEVRSRQNKNLEKPIFDDDSDEHGRAQRMEKQKQHRPRCNRCCRPKKFHHFSRPCNVRFTMFDVSKENLTAYNAQSSQEGHVGQVVKYMDPNFDTRTQKYPKFHQKVGNSHWEMNPRTGEWFKVYDNYEYREDYYNRAVTPPPPPPRQMCMCERSPPPGYNGKNLMEQSPPQARSYLTPPSTCRCSNCGFPRNSRY